MDNGNVTIPIVRFVELLDKETRLDILTDKLIREYCIDTEETLRIIGSDVAVKRADELKAEDDRKREEYLRNKYSELDA